MSSVDQILITPLYQMHLDASAKMVPFAGYEMPLQYPLGIKKEHLHTRENAGLFDVSHMGQIKPSCNRPERRGNRAQLRCEVVSQTLVRLSHFFRYSGFVNKLNSS